MRFFKSVFLFLLSLIISEDINAQTLYDVVVGTDNVPITEIQLAFDGSIITETSGGIDPTPAAGIYYVQVVQGIQTQMVKILVDK